MGEIGDSLASGVPDISVRFAPLSTGEYCIVFYMSDRMFSDRDRVFKPGQSSLHSSFALFRGLEPLSLEAFLVLIGIVGYTVPQPYLYIFET